MNLINDSDDDDSTASPGSHVMTNLVVPDIAASAEKQDFVEHQVEKQALAASAEKLDFVEHQVEKQALAASAEKLDFVEHQVEKQALAVPAEKLDFAEHHVAKQDLTAFARPTQVSGERVGSPFITRSTPIAIPVRDPGVTGLIPVTDVADECSSPDISDEGEIDECSSPDVSDGEEIDETDEDDEVGTGVATHPVLSYPVTVNMTNIEFGRLSSVLVGFAGGLLGALLVGSLSLPPTYMHYHS